MRVQDYDTWTLTINIKCSGILVAPPCPPDVNETYKYGNPIDPDRELEVTEVFWLGPYPVDTASHGGTLNFNKLIEESLEKMKDLPPDASHLTPGIERH